MSAKIVSGLQLPITPIVMLSQMMCLGRRKDGNPCGNVLAFVLLAPDMLVEIVCDKCNTRGYAGDKDQYRHLRWMTCQCGTRLAKTHVTNNGIVQIKCRSCGLTVQLERARGAKVASASTDLRV
jgi:hypothetical protein